jgi:glycosyltransferase involved in cell wall biosynthesis
MKEFSLVSTVFNEVSRLLKTISDIEGQTLKPKEVIITDAGSTDGTYEELIRWSESSSIDIVILQKPKCNVAEGRNLAIKHARHNLIVSTDFGCRFHADWLKSVIAPFEKDGVNVVGGSYSVDESSQHSLAAKANFVITNGYRIVLDSDFIPSSRSIAYYKTVWESVGGYCEWLTLAADDLVFGKAIKAKGYEIVLVNKPYVQWGRHERARGYAKEAYRYGLGDGEARVNLRNFISNLGELLLRYLLFLSIILWILNLLSSFTNSLYFSVAILFFPGLRSYVRTLKYWWKLRSSKYNLFVLIYSFILIEMTRWNYLKGYLKGYFFSTPEMKHHAMELTVILR